MAGLTNRIEQFLLQQLEQEAEGMIEIGRNELAQRFSCAPSQINYVLTTRFTPYNGYYTESKRGGAGYIRIIRLERSPEDFLGDVIRELARTEVTTDKARRLLRILGDRGMLTEREQQLLSLAIDDKALAQVSVDERNLVRAGILKNMLIFFLR